MGPTDSQGRAGQVQRQPIYRVRTGCLTCRGRKKKCDEVKPMCTGCKRNKLQCEWPTTTRNKKRGPPNHKKSSSIQSNPGAACDEDSDNSPSKPQEPAFDNADPTLDTNAVERTTIEVVPEAHVAHVADNEHLDPGHLQPQRLQIESPTAHSLLSCSSEADSSAASNPADGYDASTQVDWLPDTFDLPLDDVPIEIPPEELQQTETIDPSLALSQFTFALDGNHAIDAWIPRSVSLLPESDAPTYDLLGHYLSRTALSMGNGSTDVNPFVSQLIPLSFANKFILELVLCQSAVQRATENATQLAIAQKYYNNSLRLFRQSIDEYINGQEMTPLWIALGALIMCFTETAKGDVRGIVFDHMEAAGPLLSNLISHSDVMPEGLKNFVVEYYVYVVTISMISIDPKFGSAPVLGPQFERLAREMVGMDYIGQLCGCWLELLLLLPQIFEFGQRSTSAKPDDFITFAKLQSRITSFVSSATLGNEVAMCGHIFKHAVHIYLLTALHVGQSPTGQVKEVVDKAITEAFACLQLLPPNARINTSTCWALAVIGSCVEDEIRQVVLRDRLRVMFLAIGLGNIRSTSALLDKVWALPSTERSPWAICKVMRDNEMWMSFV